MPELDRPLWELRVRRERTGRITTLYVWEPRMQWYWNYDKMYSHSFTSFWNEKDMKETLTRYHNGDPDKYVVIWHKIPNANGEIEDIGDVYVYERKPKR